MAHPHRAHALTTDSRRGRGWNWLLLLPTVAPLLVPLYNRIDPVLWGMPFFYWYQLSCALLAIVVISTVYLKTRRPSTRPSTLPKAD